MAEAIAPSTGKRAFLVLGPESSGNRFVTRCLMAAGCDGNGDHDQKFDKPGSLKGASNLIVIRRSMPYGDEWPHLDHLMDRLRNNDYREVKVIGLMRTFYCMVESQVKANHHFRVAPEMMRVEAEDEIAAAVRRISQFALEYGLPIRWITYESLIYHFEAFRRTLAQWGLQLGEPPEEIKDKNLQWLA